MPTVTVTGRDAHVSSTNKKHAEDKIVKLEKYFSGIQKIEAILGHSGDQADVELVISVRRAKPIVCHCHAKDLYAAIDMVIDKAEVQLTKLKERIKTHKGRKAGPGEAVPGVAGADGAGRVKSADDDGLESYDEVIEKRDFSG
jgi:putative sigma-54 modulation protein